MLKHVRSAVLATIVLTVVIALPETAVFAQDQATFTVDPVQVKLSADRNNQILKITNHGEVELRAQLAAWSWDHDEDGAMELAETQDIVFFPEIVALQGGESAVVRIGTEVAFEDVEKSYRLSIEQLQSSDGLTAGQVALLTTITLPVFLQPADPQLEVHVDARIDGGEMRALVRNAGNVHATVDAVIFRGLDAEGRVQYEDSQAGWYVLAGRAHGFTHELTRAICAVAQTVEIDAVMHGEIIAHSIDISAACR